MILRDGMRRKTEFPHVVRDTNRHGNVRWVYRRSKSSPRIALAGDFGSEEFKRSYAQAVLASGEPPTPVKGGKGSLQWLVDQWKASSDWATTKPATRRQRENILLPILAKNGRLPFAYVDEATILEGRESRAATPAAANNYLKTMRALFSWAKGMKLMRNNPTQDVAFIPHKTEGHEPWVIEDIEAYRARWPIGTRQRLTVEVFYWTSLRLGDAARLGRQHLGRDGKVRLRMEKTGDMIEFDMPEQLAQIIAQSPCGDLTFIATSAGRPYAKESLGNEFREWCRAAGVKKSAHGIRKLAGAEAVEAGSTEDEVAAMLGHRNNATARIYTRSKRKERLASGAIAKRGAKKTA